MTDTVTDNPLKNRQYSRIKVRLSLSVLAIDLAVITAMAFSGLSVSIMSVIETISVNPYIQFLLFVALWGIALSIIHFPINFYGDYIIEHRFGLSKQSLFNWFFEKTKETLVSLVIGIPVTLAFFMFLRWAGTAWWIYFSLFILLISVFLARIAPVIIFPIFYKYREIENDELKERISSLLREYNIPIKGIYSFNMSKNTRKANAGFTGIGKSKRIILSDTLLEDFTVDEISVVFAHEVGHYRGHHILKNILFSTVTIFLSFYFCGMLYSRTITATGFSSLYEIAAIPILLFYLSFFSLFLMPLTNYISRRYEVEADTFALSATGDRKSFISAMEKLAAINLSDTDPHPLVEFFLYSHPSIRKRISLAENY